jgi:hypothetical protein
MLGRRIGTAMIAVLPWAVMPAAPAEALRPVVHSLAAVGTSATASATVATTGAMASGGSMARQNAAARAEGYVFMRTPEDVRDRLARGDLVHAVGNEDYQLANVSFPVARPEVVVFLERLAADYRAACGEKLVVTSLTRPITRQPRNSSPLSVHPAGMAIDLRIPARTDCRRWLETRLLELQAADVLEVIRERRPPHYHVGLFTAAYRQLVEAEVEVERARMWAEEEALLRSTLSAAHIGGSMGGGRYRWLMLLVLTPGIGLVALRWRRAPSPPEPAA